MTQPTILLIDDDSDLLQAIGDRCRHLGLNVQHARNLLTATAMIEKYVPDVVCVDVHMPTGNGLRFCEMLSADAKTARVPIIVLTGQQDVATIEACQRLDAHYLFKSADTWTHLEPLLQALLPPEPSDATPTTTGIRPRKLPANAIPPWPGEADAGNKNRADAGNSDNSTARQIVVADDDTDLVRMLSQRFSSLGCSVIGVNSALEAINAIHRMAPDLVVLDVNMPSGNGLSVCEMMSTDDRLRLIPVIILTGQSDEKTIRRCHDMLVFYVQKGTNIWSRVEPLVRELLHLDDAPTAVARPLTAEPPPTSAVASGGSDANGGGDNQDTLVDAVFAMLGADTCGLPEFTDSEIEAATTTAAMATENVPWVLCIDDDADFSDALKIRFEEHGVAVARAASGMEGYCMAFSSPASAILLDYNMPNGQGDYILGRLKDNRVTNDIPVFVITGVKDKMLERRMMALGAAGYFQKPVDFNALRDRLAAYINILAKPAPKLVASSAN